MSPAGRKTVLITGANRGIGLAFTRSYYLDGWKVMAACRDPEGAKNLPSGVTPVALDLASNGSIEALAEACVGKSIDLLINNAAIHGPRDASGSFGALDLEEWLYVLRINALGPVKLTERLLPNILASNDRRIVFISSRAGSITERGSQPHHRTGGPYVYRTSKATLNAAVKAIGFDLQKQGVSVLALHPGWVKTETGGWDAPGTPEESVLSMRQIIDQSKPEENGVLRNYDGSVIPW